VTLLGDAAHPPTPNLGQGPCQALEDALALVDCLEEQREPVAGMPRLRGTPQEVQRRRHPAVRSVQQDRQVGAAAALHVTRWTHPARLRDVSPQTLRCVPEHPILTLVERDPCKAFVLGGASCFWRGGQTEAHVSLLTRYERCGTRNLFVLVEPIAGLAARGGDSAMHQAGLCKDCALVGR
jgi:hypothetical protein